MELTRLEHAVIVLLRIVVQQKNLKYTRDTIVRTVRMGTDDSFRFN